MKTKTDAYVTVYISLMLGIMMIFVTTVISAARHQTSRMETECVMDAGISSIFAEYHREMLKQYGLLFIDDSYGGTGDVNNTKEHLLSYMNKNFSGNDTTLDITGLKADNCSFNRISFASDNKGEVLRYQIAQYMKHKKGINLFSNDTMNPIDDEYEDKYENYDNKRTDVDGEIDEIVNMYNANLPQEEQVGISNPADAVDHLSSNSALYYACKDLSALSTNVTNTKNLISNRNYKEGVGLYGNQESPYGAVDIALYYDYLFDKLAYKDKEKTGACLNYQLEYLIAGKDGDIENLENIAEKIFKARYLVNVSHIYQCATKQQQAMELATVATTAIGQPELIEAVKTSILLAWAYAESAKDMRILFDGHKLSAVKTESEWNTPIEQIANFKSHLDDYKIPTGNIGYKDFIHGFILLQNKEEQNMRLMDVMEMDIRLTSGNSQFCVNNLIYQLYAEVNVSGIYGQGYSIERGFSYR